MERERYQARIKEEPIGRGEVGFKVPEKFFRNFESDLTSSDGFLFDSSLVSFPLHFACDNCWSAGEGGAGIHISGGAEIAFSHAQIRTNANDGILIDGPLVKQVQITDSSIGGNNTSN